MLLPDSPALPEPYVPRPRLHHLLHVDVARFAVTNVVAPAAFGKTTLLVGWQRSELAPALVYVALDALDNDEQWFAARLDAAVSRLLRDSGPDGEDLRVLVFDGLDLLDNPVVLDRLGDFLLDLPRGLRVVLTSRVDAAPRQGLLRARGQLVDITADDLAFDASDIAVLVREHDVEVDAADLATTAASSGGWVGALKLAVMARTPGPGREALSERVSGRNPYVADLLRTEVLDARDPELRRFLLASAVVDEFDAALCDALTGQRTSAAVLERFRREGLVVPGEDPSRYRYQRLFRDFLRHHLETVDPEQRWQAHQAAAAWFAARGDVTAAVHHLVAGDDGAAAVRLVLEHGEPTAARGEVDTVHGWLRLLPDEVVTRDATLLAGISHLCVTLGMRDEALMWLERARWRVDEVRDREAAIELAVLTAYTRGQGGDLHAAIGDARRALRLAEAADEPDPTVVSKIHHLLASTYTGLDEFDEARRHQHAAPNNGDNDFPANAYGGWLSLRTGLLGRAVDFADAHLSHTKEPWLLPIAYASRGAVARERNQPEEAEANLVAAIDLAREWSRPLTAGFATVELALTRHGEGRFADAHELLRTARQVAEGTDLHHRVDVTEAHLWLSQGNVERAILLRETLPTGRETQLLDARIALALGDRDETERCLARAEVGARSRQEQIATRLLRARLALDDDSTAALGYLREAVELGRPEGFVQVFLDDLGDLGVLARGLVTDSDDPYVFGLLAAVADLDAGTSSAPGTDNGSAQLSTREQAVLRYLPTGLSNKDIAAELHISVNTLKTHLKSINRKLGTASRAEAVSAARSIALV